MLIMWVVWIVMMVGLMAGLHYYFWIRLVRDTAFVQPWRTVLSVALVTLAASIPLAFWIGRQFAGAGRDVLVWVAFVWMGLMFLLFLALVSADLVRWLTALGLRVAGNGDVLNDPQRRVFLSRLVAGGAAAGAVSLSGLALRGAARPPEVKRVRVGLSRLPEQASGTTIVQITDLHVGQPITRDYVADVVRRTNALAPDIIAITGDLVDGGTVHLRDAIAPIADLTARHGVYFVTGNHEYYSGVEPWLETLRAMGIRVLRNEHVTIGEDSAAFVLAGVDDSTAHRLADGHREDVAAAVAGVDSDREVVLLAHQPKAIFEAAKHGVGLQISGHTHGGQIWPFTLFVHLAQPYVAGLARHGATQIYVSRGTGHWGPPMRLGAPSELTLIELVRDDTQTV
jgi:predicted MPP superfamily phosphohydrolase